LSLAADLPFLSKFIFQWSRAGMRCAQAHPMTSRGRALRAALLSCLGALTMCWGPPGSEPAIAAPAEAQIQASIDRAVAFLKQHVVTGESGQTSLATLALLKAGVSKDSPEVKVALERIAARFETGGKFKPGSHWNYDAGVTLMALATADPEKYLAKIQAIADFIISNQGPDGDWDYAARQTGDTSISQYAILGLWEASRAGARVPARVWDKAAAWHISRQQADGGFSYHPSPPRQGFPSAGGSTYTMTVAGTASLLVTRLHLFGEGRIREPEESAAPAKRRASKKFGLLTPATTADDELEPEIPVARAEGPYTLTIRANAIDAAVTKGHKWLTDRFAISPDTPWKLYYLYGIERLTALAGLTEIAGHDWYAEGAQALVSSQDPMGSWSDNSGNVAATSFGTMFLIKATAKMLNRQRRPDKRFGGGLLVGGRGLPENLQEVQLDKGGVSVRKMKGAVDELLAELENVSGQRVESAQASLVETVMTENPEALIGQKERLLRLLNDRRLEVRRTAYWALGRTNDYRVVPVLIDGLLDKEVSVAIEAYRALQYISKRKGLGTLPDEPADADRTQAVAAWKKWYQSVRPYEERDDLTDGARP
jgi:hypothetical protein